MPEYEIENSAIDNIAREYHKYDGYKEEKNKYWFSRPIAELDEKSDKCCTFYKDFGDDGVMKLELIDAGSLSKCGYDPEIWHSLERRLKKENPSKEDEIFKDVRKWTYRDEIDENIQNKVVSPLMDVVFKIHKGLSAFVVKDIAKRVVFRKMHSTVMDFFLSNLPSKDTNIFLSNIPSENASFYYGRSHFKAYLAKADGRSIRMVWKLMHGYATTKSSASETGGLDWIDRKHYFDGNCCFHESERKFLQHLTGKDEPVVRTLMARNLDELEYLMVNYKFIKLRFGLPNPDIGMLTDAFVHELDFVNSLEK